MATQTPSSAAVDRLEHQRRELEARYGLDASTERQTKILPILPYPEGLSLLDYWDRQIDRGLAAVESKPIEVQDRFYRFVMRDRATLDAIRGELAAPGALAGEFSGDKTAAVLWGDQTERLWDLCFHIAAELDSLSVVPDAWDLAVESVRESIAELPQTLGLPRWAVPAALGLAVLLLVRR